MTRRCPSCGELLPQETSRFCVSCGESLIAGTDQQPNATRSVPDAKRPVPDAARPVPEGGARPPRQQLSGFRRSRRRGWVVTLLALIVLGAAGVGTFALLSSHRGNSARHTPPRQVAAKSPTQSSSPTANSSPTLGTEQSELRQITAMIQQSASARNTVVSATKQVGNCTMRPATGISLMNQAVNQRQAIINSMGSLSMVAIPSGQQMLADLKNSLQLSIAADQGFIGWMQDIQNSATCPVNTSSDRSYQTAYQMSIRAGNAKKEFLAIWNPIASQFGQPTFTASKI